MDEPLLVGPVQALSDLGNELDGIGFAHLPFTFQLGAE